jgi:hypothetical protein
MAVFRVLLIFPDCGSTSKSITLIGLELLRACPEGKNSIPWVKTEGVEAPGTVIENSPVDDVAILFTPAVTVGVAGSEPTVNDAALSTESCLSVIILLIRDISELGAAP